MPDIREFWDISPVQRDSGFKRTNPSVQPTLSFICGNRWHFICTVVSDGYDMFYYSLTIIPYSWAFHPSVLFGFALCGSYGSVTGVLRLHVYIGVT